MESKGQVKMSTVILIEKTKNEITETINNCISKYGVDIGILNLIINDISNNIKNTKNNFLMEELKKNEKND